MAAVHPHPTTSWCEPSCQRRGTRGAAPATVTCAHPLRMAERTFDLLVRGPGGLAVDGAALGHGLPETTMCLHALRRLLRAAGTSETARDAAWRHVIDRARSEPQPWQLAALGLTTPGLGKIMRRLRTNDADVASVAVLAFLAAVNGIDLDEGRVYWRLYNRAHSAARTAAAAVEPARSGELDLLGASAPPAPLFGHPDFVLGELVHSGVITVDEAELIAVTRLENLDMRDYARQMGLTYRAVRTRRMRAEQRLVAALHTNTKDGYVGRHRKAEYPPRHGRRV
jgi:predicted DNA-binding protein (UPF0251 family)